MTHIEREYKTHIQLQHPNILNIKDFLTEHDLTLIVMELCEGPDLAQYLREEQRLDWAVTLSIGRQVVDALLYLAARDPIVIHYDLKPQNVIFHRGVVKLVDFGLCKLIDPRSTRI